MDVNKNGSENLLQNYDKDQIETSIVHRFKLQVKNHPSRIAIQTEDTSFSYQQLDQEINFIAHAIQQHISKPSQVILLMEQNEWMIAGLFAVLATDNLYVPLDSSYPEARLAFMVKDCAASLIITDRRHKGLAECLVGNNKTPILVIEEVPKKYEPTFNILVKPDSLAYILYTSGTKGTPKGVLQNHRNVLHFNQVYSNALKIQPDDRLSLLASFCFDAAVMDIFAALLNGATLYPYSVKTKSIAEVFAWLGQNKISIFHSTPTVFRYLFHNKLESYPLHLRLVVLGGELALRKDWQLYHKHCPSNCLLVNGYGPTESSVSTQFIINKNMQITQNTLPIGYAVAKTTVYLKKIINHHGEASEEIIIKSPFVALRYWGMPELSQKVFINENGEREYCTGDAGRLLCTGAIEYLKRIDDQVKISGYRIELDEITHYLLEYPGIQQVVCQARPDYLDGFKLAVYFSSEKDIRNADLVGYLKTYLPEHMIPTIFVQVTDIPKTPNGKVDFDALMALEPTLKSPHFLTFLPDQIEKELIEMCLPLLGVKSLDVFDNIFEIGCNSLTAMQLTSRISQKYTIDFSIKYLFTAPRITDLSREVARLKSINNCSALSEVSSKQRNKHPLASYAQQQFLFLSKLDSACDFSLAISVKMRGIIHTSLLQKAFIELISRHEILRTIVSYQGGQLVQLIIDEPLSHLEVEHLFHVEKECREASIKTKALEEASAPFDPLKGPLIRAKLLQYDSEFQVLILCCSHGIIDGWAFNIFSQELSVIYNSLLEDKNSPLVTGPGFQYADYSIWQNTQLENNAWEPQRDYWQKQLANLPFPIQIDKNKSRPPILSTQTAELNFVIGEGALTELQLFSDKHQVTLFMTVLAIFQILLNHYSEQEDIIVGTPIANRNLPEFESIIGCMVNTIALRGRLQSNLSFLDFLQQIKETTLDAYDNQDLPFVEVVKSLGLDRNGNISPVFQIMLTLENIQKYDFSFQGVKSEITEISLNQSIFDIILSIEVSNKTLACSFKYKKDLVSDDLANQFVDSFEQILLMCIRFPQKNLEDLAKHTDRLASLPAEYPPPIWNATDKDYPLECTIQQLFNEQVEKNPDAIAVIYLDQQLTYSELNKKANQVAHYLIAHGILPHSVVAICLEPSLELIIALLGILKANAAYLPLDTESPESRIHFILNDARPFFLITNALFRGKFFEDNAIPCLVLNETHDSINDFPYHNPLITITSTELLYVIYTSGSTGEPKGVMINHKGIINYLFWLREQFPPTSNDAFLQKTSYCFDPSVREFFFPLLFGVKLILTTPGRHKESFYLCNMLREHQISFIGLVPSMLQALLEEPHLKKNNQSVKMVICGGEELSLTLKKRFFECFDSEKTVLYNSYGPTEASIAVAYWQCNKENTLDFVPIGRPIANTQLHILDDSLQCVPVGESGTLYIGGVSLAQGYLNRPELTKEKFIQHPRFQERLYNTGDLCCWSEKGFIQFLGRRDFQIKIRGHRVELDEIANQLMQHPTIKNCVVIANEDTHQQKKLIAYIIPETGMTPSQQALQEFLSLHLPYYMIPSAIISLCAFPLNTSGKLDRKALPQPAANELVEDIHYVAPRNRIEERLSKLLANLLNISLIGVHDNFFYLGGHSLLAVQLIALISREFGVELPLKIIFLQPTIAAMAHSISKQTQLLAQTDDLICV